MGDRPTSRWDELQASTDFLEVFRCTKGVTSDVFKSRVLLDGKVEICRVTQQGGMVSSSSLFGTFQTADQAREALSKIEDALEEDGWEIKS